MEYLIPEDGFNAGLGKDGKPSVSKYNGLLLF